MREVGQIVQVVNVPERDRKTGQAKVRQARVMEVKRLPGGFRVVRLRLEEVRPGA